MELAQKKGSYPMLSEVAQATGADLVGTSVYVVPNNDREQVIYQLWLAAHLSVFRRHDKQQISPTLDTTDS